MFRLKHTRTLRLALLLGLYENLTKQKTLFIVKNMSFLSPSILTTQGPFSPVPCSLRTTALRCHLQKEKAINPIPNGLGVHSLLLPRPEQQGLRKSQSCASICCPFPLASPFTFMLKSVLKLLLKVCLCLTLACPVLRLSCGNVKDFCLICQGPRKNSPGSTSSAPHGWEEPFHSVVQ